MKLFVRKDNSMSTRDLNQNSIVALLKGPDILYKKILTEDHDKLPVSINNEECRDKNSFLQIHVRPLSAKQQKRLLKKQYHHLSKRHRQSIKKQDNCLRFTFPINYPCLINSKTKQTSSISNSSISSPLLIPNKTTSQLSNNINQLKSAVSIAFIDDKIDDMLTNKILKQNYSSSLLHIPSKKIFTHKNHSSNASIQKHICHLCNSILSNGICSCIVKYLLQLNHTKDNHILDQFNDIF